MDKERLVPYPELVYRRDAGDEVVEESVLKIAVKCYYPEELTALVESFGFELFEKWGDYMGEAYGVGLVLVVEFGKGNRKWHSTAAVGPRFMAAL